MSIGYARVSTREQNVALQVYALKVAGCTLRTGIFRESSAERIGVRPQPEH